MEQKINLNINEGDAFFAHELSINFNPMQFIFDFKCVTPRMDMRNKEGPPCLNLKHNVIMTDPFHAKEVLKLLTRVIDNYEKEFGEITKPKPIEVFEKKNKERIEQMKKPNQTPSYFG